jgi:surface polysaccharide O-acyltransferase-like enzyme
MWFLWILLLLGAVAAALHALVPGWDEGLGRRLSGVLDRPVRSFVLLLLVSAAAYLPLAIVFHPLHWTYVGPFAFQTSRIILYATYFFGGVVVGTLGLGRGLLAPEGRLARRWPAWVGMAVLAYALTVAAVVAAGREGAGPGVQVFAGLTFVFSCAASSFALLAVFLRFAKKATAARESLRENAYGIYIVHYVFVSWLQLSLLPVPLGALTKGTAVIVGAVLLSWGTTAALRRLPAVRAVV